MSDPGFKVEGLRETVAAFRAVDRELPRQMQKEFKAIAEFVRDRIRSKVPGRAGGAIGARATTTFAAITRPKGGPGDRSSRYGYYPWLDFGGGALHARGVTASTDRQFRRPFIKEGRYIYPTIGDYYGEIVDSALIAVERVADRAGFDTEGFPHG